MNVIFILADDLGWADTSLYGHTRLYETPNLERLAERGMVFTRAYASSPLCSPTRASIMTGQIPARHGSTAPQHHTPTVRLKASVAESAPPGNKALATQSVPRLDTAFPTLAKLLKAREYATGHFGKWHLGAEPYSPLQHGFDVDIQGRETQYRMELTSPGETVATVGIPKEIGEISVVKANGKPVWRHGAYVGGVDGIMQEAEDDRYIKFRVDPGQWYFEANE